MLMGTVGYMSAEQVRGTEAGPLSDIFSFGAVLYEMIAGKRAFDGETGVEVMNAILKEDPEQLPDSVPSGVRAIVGHCLEKKPEQRFQSAQDLAFALRSVSGATTTSSPSLTVLPASRPARMRWLSAPLLVAAGVLIGGAVALRWAASFDTGIDPIKLTRFAAEPEQESFPAFAPDGRSVAYVRGTLGNFELVLKPLDAPPSVSPVALATGQFQSAPVWTPDSTRVCYKSLRDLWCLSAAGGKPQRLLADVASAAFSRDGSLLLIRIENGKPSLLVSSPPGSEPKVVEGVTLPDGAADLRGISPDGTRLLLGSRDFFAAWIAPYPTGQPKKLEEPPSWTPLPAGWLPDGRHAVVIEASDNLRFRLVLAETESRLRRLVVPDTGAIISAAISPDGKRIMYSTGQPDWDIGEYSMDGKRLRPMAVSPEMDVSPSWSPSGDRFLYGIASTSGRSGSMWTRNSDGSGASILANASLGLYRYSPDGRRIAGATRDIRGIGIDTMPAAGGRPIRIVSATDINNLCWSPDGEWLWYASAGKLAKVPSQGGKAVTVHDAVEGLIDCSPDGRLIAYTTKNAIHLISPEGQQDRLLTSEGFYSLASGLYGSRGQFSKSGDVLYLLRDDGRSIDVIDTITGKLQGSIQFELAHADIINQFSIHPDGKRVLLCTGGLRYDLWMAEGFAQPAKGWMRWFRHWDAPTQASGESLNQTAQ
jgi:Tol biopolymer transport system component